MKKIIICITICLIAAYSLQAKAQGAASSADSVMEAASESDAVVIDTSLPTFGGKADGKSAVKDSAAKELEAKPLGDSSFPEKAKFIKSRDTDLTTKSAGVQTGGAIKWVVGLLFLSMLAAGLFYMKKKGIVMAARPKAGGQLKLVHSLNVGPKHRIAILESPRERLIVGLSGDRMTLLKCENAFLARDLMQDDDNDFDAEIDSVSLGSLQKNEDKTAATNSSEPASESVEPPQAADSPVAKQIESRVKNLKRFLTN